MTKNRKRLLAVAFAAMGGLGTLMLNSSAAHADASPTCDDKACDAFTCTAKTGSMCTKDDADTFCASTPCVK